MPGLETFSQVRNVSPDLNEVRVQHLTKLEMSSPDLSEVRVQRLVLVGTVNASPSEVRAHLQSVFLSVFNRLKGFRLKAVRLENLQSASSQKDQTRA